MNGSNFVKVPLRTNAILNIENDDKLCFIWSKIASPHPLKIFILTEFQKPLHSY